MNVARKYTILFCLFFTSILLHGQNVGDSLKRAEEYHNNYEFDKAINIYSSLLENVADSVLKNSVMTKMVQSENGKNMLQYATPPKVLATKTVSVDDFYLYYSHFQNNSWAKIPNTFVREGWHPYYSAVYFPGKAKQIFFSSQDNSGTWNIYSSDCKGDSLWTIPSLINENITSPEDDIFPILSPSGKELYFSSAGLFGMGGYDLFVSRWNEELHDWGTPENLGFPFSSPYDDFLFCDTPDGNFSVFASNRGCSADSMTIYVIAFENTPVKKAVNSLSQARSIAQLLPIKKDAPSATASQNEHVSHADSIFSQYSSLLSSLRKMQDTLSSIQLDQNKNRELYSTIGNNDEQKAIEKKLLKAETLSLEIQSRISLTSDKIQEMEMNFLGKGVVINLEDLSDTPAQETTVSPEYSFAKQMFGEIGNLPFEVPEETFDYSFKILDTAVLAQSDILLDTLVYQIQLFVTSHKVMLKQLHGLSPVFENRLSSGKYQYTVGLFYSYKEVLSHLNTVKKRGFPSAFIIASNRGKNLPVSKARVLEATYISQSKYSVVLEQFPDGIPDQIVALIKDHCTKDIAKSITADAILYIIAPFETRKEAENLASILVGEGVEGVIIEKLN